MWKVNESKVSSSCRLEGWRWNEVNELEEKRSTKEIDRRKLQALRLRALAAIQELLLVGEMIRHI